MELSMDELKIKKINKILKWLLIVGFILLAVLSINYKFNDCQKCNFEYNDSILSSKEVWETYRGECLIEFTTKIGFEDLNFSDLPLNNYKKVLNNINP